MTLGGRGASSGMSKAGKPYGSEYRTVLQSGNIKFVQRINGSASAPLETMTKGRIYATVNAADEVKYISYYDTENKRTKTIDLDKPHKGMSPHVHHGYNHNENDGSKGATELSIKEREMVDNVLRMWYNKKASSNVGGASGVCRCPGANPGACAGCRNAPCFFIVVAD